MSRFVYSKNFSNTIEFGIKLNEQIDPNWMNDAYKCYLRFRTSLPKDYDEIVKFANDTGAISVNRKKATGPAPDVVLVIYPDDTDMSRIAAATKKLSIRKNWNEPYKFNGNPNHLWY